MFLSLDPFLPALGVPLFIALLIGLGLPKRWSVRLSYIGFLAPLLSALHVWWYFASSNKVSGFAFYNAYSTGIDRLGIGLKFGVNGLSMPLYVLAGIVGFAAGLYAIRSGADRLKLYLMLLLVMQAGLMGIFASVDIFYIYFFHELALIPTFIMVGLWGGRDRNYAAMKMTIYLTVGAMLSLFGLIAIYVKSGVNSFDLITLKQALADHPLELIKQQHFLGILLLGLGILVSLWPFHTWAPLGYGAAPSSASMLHAGVLKKFGLYMLIQVVIPLLPEGLSHWSHLLALLALFGNVIVIGLVTIAQRDLKQMIGFSSVMHMGYAFLGIAAGSALGTGGVVMLMVAHGLSVALLFLLTASIHQRTETYSFNDMGGLARKAPVLAALFTAATFASIGLPGFANFWGELSIFIALWHYSAWMTCVAILGVIISAIYGLRSAAYVFFGEPTNSFKLVDSHRPASDITYSEKIPALILLIALLFVGFYPASLTNAINSSLPASEVHSSTQANVAASH